MLNIKDVETDRLARQLAKLTGEFITQAVRTAVEERLEREQRHRGRASVEQIMAIARRFRIPAGHRRSLSRRDHRLRRARVADLMVVDTSVVVAIFLLEPEAEPFAHAILEAPRAIISAANLLEAGIILDSRIGHRDSTELDEFVVNVGLEVEPVTVDQVRIARQAYRTYGKGNHPAALNFGDCFAYALAKTTGLPLLYKGDDFAQTDISGPA